MPCGDEGRDGAMLLHCKNHQRRPANHLELGDRQGTQSLSRSSEGTNPADTLISDLEPPELHEVININLKNKPEWFFEKNPLGLVPVLENSQGQLIYESTITCEYLDEAYPGKKLLPDDPYEKARQKMIFELSSQIPTLLICFLRGQNKDDYSGQKEQLHKEFSKLEEVLTNKKTTFFGGKNISMVDYLIWPWFERLEAVELIDCVDHTPKLKLWMEAMRKDPTVSALITDAKTLRGFTDLYLQNSPDACDYGL
uniref:Glutathione S-transferase omega n=1 Tax=Equus asinus TaxID=9793 RepID=A0A9L0ICF2_EQUAS